MTGSGIWNIRGVSSQARAAAEDFSDRSELSLGAWIDQIIRQTEHQTDKTTAMSDSDKDNDEDRSVENEIMRVLENLESRIDEHTDRISEQLAPVQDSVSNLEERIQQLEHSFDDRDETQDAEISDEPPAATDDVDEDTDMSDDPVADDDVAEPDAPDSGPDLELIQGERLFETDALSDADISVADQAVKSDLEGLFDDGAHANADDEVPPAAAIPPSGTTERSRPVYLLVIAVLLLVAGVGIATFIWFELTSPRTPLPTNTATENDSPPAAAPAAPEPAAPPAPPNPPASASSATTAQNSPNDVRALPEPQLNTPAPPAQSPADDSDKKPAEPTAGGEISALDALRNAAAAGDADAQNDLAVRYLVGRGVEQDYAEAAKWLQEAAASNITSAQYNLGVLYDSGRGVPVDPVEALIWFHSAAEKGHGRAQYALAAAYAAGRGIGRDQDMALKWLRRAAESNVLEAQSSLANILATSPVSRDSLTDAYFWYRVADANGDGRAADRADQVAARLTPEERAEINRRASRFISENIVGKRPATARRSTPAAATAPRPTNETAAAPPPAPTDTNTPDSERVRQIQTLLSALGFRPGPADGAMGRQTRDAIREYQRELGLEVDGEPSSELLAHLRQLSGIGQ